MTYLNSGALKHAAFALTPSSGTTYTASDPAGSRAVAVYSYDPGGRVTALEYYWQTLGSSSCSDEAIVKNTCDYELSTGTSNLNRGLKTASKLWEKALGSPSFNSTPYQTDTYGYDATRDYLTSASYGDGNPNATPSWTYDAAGNRNDATADNLNRLTASTGSYTYESDILGNRTWRNRYTSTGGVRMTWDVLNRMLSCCNASGGAKYTYRADGMRTKKVEDLSLSWIPPSSSEEMDDDTSSSGYYDPITSTNKPTTRYFYDGQMCMGAASSSDTAGLRRNP